MSRSAHRGPEVRARDLLAVPFVLVRVPLYLLDRQLVQRLDPHSPVRTVFDCGLGSVDILAGHALDDETITRYGMGRIRGALYSRPAVPGGSGAAVVQPALIRSRMSSASASGASSGIQ